MPLSEYRPFNLKFTYIAFAIFWIVAFVINAGPHWEQYSSTKEMIETAGMVTSLQLFVALITMYILVPKLLDKDKVWLFCIALFALIIVASEINILIRYFHLEKNYPDTYKGFLSVYGHMTLAERMNLSWTMRYIIFSKIPLFLFPTILLMSYRYYREQQKLLRLSEHKRTAELEALKNQLNPHFLFNTLNNIYTLALKKSDETPVAIEKLSGILDYVVYRCNETYVSLKDELKLIEDYIALEKIRYRDRLNVSVEKQISTPCKIAPLILLTLIENACKHSTREELGQAKISITIATLSDDINITISNTKPKTSIVNSSEKCVGLDNLKQQLNLLYPESHHLITKDTPSLYTTTLRLRQK
jgi:hypothetical protein